MSDVEKLVEIINDFFGCDASYFDVNPFDLATHILKYYGKRESDLLESTEKKEPKVKGFKSENGRVYMLPDNHCAFCENCTHIVYDYTYGPYMFVCDKDLGDYKVCGQFKEG